MRELARRAAIRAAIAGRFTKSDDPHDVVRRRDVALVVGALLGEPASPALYREVHREAMALGAVPISFCNRRLFKGFRPRSASAEEVERLATALRRNPKTNAAVLRNARV